ncbi:PREDICTED: 40S ribosomal protein S27-like [Odobenus rosmarus divergens]|uniref:40S ribosomal protein S27-like n=1 Tax=Odobenus rosmarus divergens TaxID=9708 RepID=A0A2U3VZR3_ODORO|nr:PREDICTED: 40S ribosomal protein S27-like [Odobenus rosmarus divergens]
MALMVRKEVKSTGLRLASSSEKPNVPLTKDLLHPSLEEEKRKHKKKHLVQTLNSCFTDVKCPGSYGVTTISSHAQTVVVCQLPLCPLQPTGGKARLTEGCSIRQKQH